MFKCGFYYLKYSDSFTLIDLGTSPSRPSSLFFSVYCPSHIYCSAR